MTTEPRVDHDAAAQQFWRSPDPGAERMATGRLGLRPAPGGLALVQDFLNTGAQPHRFPDLPGLSDLRDAIEGLVTHRVAVVTVGDLGSVALSRSRSGELCWPSAGDGWRWRSAAVCAEVLASRERGTWWRVKRCATSTCRVVFYGRTWNNSVQLHASTCGV